jgi:hypothetical protein
MPRLSASLLLYPPKGVACGLAAADPRPVPASSLVSPPENDGPAASNRRDRARFAADFVSNPGDDRGVVGSRSERF